MTSLSIDTAAKALDDKHCMSKVTNETYFINVLER